MIAIVTSVVIKNLEHFGSLIHCAVWRACGSLSKASEFEANSENSDEEAIFEHYQSITSATFIHLE